MPSIVTPVAMNHRSTAAFSMRSGHGARGVSSRVLYAGLLGLIHQAVWAADASGWAVAGRQGVVRMVIVPIEQASDRSAYDREIALLCEPEQTCFLNFYTNSTGAPVALPLPDAIANESTATYRRSAKQGAERLMWSCRMKIPGEACF